MLFRDNLMSKIVRYKKIFVTSVHLTEELVKNTLFKIMNLRYIY
jgi:hypothetical protein